MTRADLGSPDSFLPAQFAVSHTWLPPPNLLEHLILPLPLPLPWLLAMAKLPLHLGIDSSACSHKKPKEIPGSMVEAACNHRQAAVLPRPRQKKQAMVGQTSLQPHLRLGLQIWDSGRCGFSSVPGPPPEPPAPKPPTLGQPQLPLGPGCISHKPAPCWPAGFH